MGEINLTPREYVQLLMDDIKKDAKELKKLGEDTDSLMETLDTAYQIHMTAGSLMHSLAQMSDL